MLTIERILFPTSFAAGSERALDAALSLAGMFDAELHMLHAVVLHSEHPDDPAHRFPDPEEMRRRLEQAALRRVASGGEDRSAPMPRVRHHRRRGMSVAPVILEQATELEADLIVMSTSGRRGLDGVLQGSVCEEVVRRAPCPVLTLRSGAGETDFPSSAPILVPVDLSEHSRRALVLARELAGRFGADLHVLHVFERPIHPEIHLGGMPLDSPQFRTVETSLREALETFVRETAGPEVPTGLFVVDGRAVPGILEFAGRDDAGLIVIATHGLTGLAHVLLGSVTERIVRRAECPVLTARAFRTKPAPGSDAGGRET